MISAITLSCDKKIEDGNGSTPPTPPANRYPIANAGNDVVIILPKDSVVLDGTQSHDPDGTVDYYYWKKISGPGSFLIRDPYLATTVVANLKAGVHLFELYITDDKGASGKDTVQVTVKTGTGDCGIIELPEINATLTEIGNLSFPQSPYVASAGSKIVFGGGSHGFSDVDIYDVAHHTWQTHQLSRARTNMAVVSCGTNVFFAGGNNWDNWYDVVDIYNVSTEIWTVKHLSEPKSFMGAASIGDKVFFAGGITDEVVKL